MRSSDIATVIALAASACGTGSGTGTLVLDVRTDLRPAIEFAAVEVVAPPELGDRRHEATSDDDFLDGVRVARFELPRGEHRFELRLLERSGRVVTRSALSYVVSEGGIHAATVTLSRRCVELECADGQSCNRGRCGPDRCTEETPEACPPAECVTDGDCAALAAECGVARCAAGACLLDWDDGACAGARVCVPDVGCVEPPPSPATLFIGPEGDDDGPGTADEPLATWAVALARLAPSDTLGVLPGSYSPTDAGRLVVGCAPGDSACAGAPCAQGSADAPITVRAVEERAARLGTDGAGPALVVSGCRGWSFEGLVAEGGDFERQQAVAVVREGANVTLRRMLLRRANRLTNSPVLQITDTDDVLLEESEIYDFHLAGVALSEARGTILRRNFIHSREYPNLPDDYEQSGLCASCCLGIGDQGVLLDRSAASLLENNVIERVCQGVVGSAGATARVGGAAGDDHRLLGNVVIGASSNAYVFASACGGADPCDDPGLQLRRLLIRDSVALDSGTGFYARGVIEARLRNVTAIDSGGSDYVFDLPDANRGLTPSFTVENALDHDSDGSGGGYVLRDHEEYTIRRVHSSGNDTDFTGTDPSRVIEATRGDPELGSCRIAVPAGSRLSGAGLEGGDIGADVRLRYHDGVRSARGLWHASTRAFPCGAIVEGVNDDPSRACAGAHDRIGVTDDCF